MPSKRVEEALERLAEDENLLADLDDSGAEALRSWIERQIAAADTARTDGEFVRRVTAIRKAARAAARSGDADPVAAAEARLAAGPDAPSRKAGADYQAAAAHLLAPAAQATESPAAALLGPQANAAPAAEAAPAAGEALAASGAAEAQPGAAVRTGAPIERDRGHRRSSRRRFPRWRYRKGR